MASELHSRQAAPAFLQTGMCIISPVGVSADVRLNPSTGMLPTSCYFHLPPCPPNAPDPRFPACPAGMPHATLPPPLMPRRPPQPETGAVDQRRPHTPFGAKPSRANSWFRCVLAVSVALGKLFNLLALIFLFTYKMDFILIAPHEDCQEEGVDTFSPVSGIDFCPRFSPSPLSLWDAEQGLPSNCSLMSYQCSFSSSK